MKPISLFFSVIVSMLSAANAQPKFKYDKLSSEQKAWLYGKVKSIHSNIVQIEFNFSTDDLTEKIPSTEKEKPVKLKEIEAEKKKLKKLKGMQRIGSLNSIANGYRNIYMTDSANVYYGKERDILLHSGISLTAEHYAILGFAYFNLGIVDSAIWAFEKESVLENNPANKSMLNFVYLMSGNMLRADSLATEEIRGKSDQILNYFIKWAAGLLVAVSNPDTVKARWERHGQIKDIIDFSYLDSSAGYKQGLYAYKLLWQLHMTTNLLFRQITMNLDTTNYLLRSDSLSRAEAAKINAALDQFLNDKSINNTYVLYGAKSLLAYLNTDYDACISLARTAIDNFGMGATTLHNTSTVWKMIVAAHISKRDTAAAIITLKEIIQKKPSVNPNSADYSALAQIYFMQGDYENAEDWAMEALRINDRETKAILLAASMSVISGEYSVANSWLQALFKRDPDNKNLYIINGCCRILQGDYQTAYESLNAVVQVIPDDIIAKEIIDYFYE